jgi:hypothetical protein
MDCEARMGSMLEARLFHGAYGFPRPVGYARPIEDPLAAARGIIFAALASVAMFWMPLVAWLVSRG